MRARASAAWGVEGVAFLSLHATKDGVTQCQGKLLPRPSFTLYASSLLCCRDSVWLCPALTLLPSVGAASSAGQGCDEKQTLAKQQQLALTGERVKLHLKC
eukprot:1158835-Pelagomonas_calceolata.AAC.5